MTIKDQNGKVRAKITAMDINSPGCDEGIWVEIVTDDGTTPCLCFVKDTPDGPHNGNWYLGVYRDVNNPSIGCDVALIFDPKSGPKIQVVRGEQVKLISLFDLIL